MNISLITKENIQSGKLKDLIPEFYELKDVVENNDWHHNENVFDHTLFVLDNLEKELEKVNAETSKHLDTIIDKYTRRELLIVATIFHDIAKKETLIVKDGITYCYNHPDEGANKAKSILSRFDLTDKESEYILRIIKSHGLITAPLLLPSNQNFESDLIEFKKKYIDIYPELILLSYADTVGSYLIKSRPEEYKDRMEFYTNEIKNMLQRSNN